MIIIHKSLRDKNYKEAASMIDAMIADSTCDHQALIQQLKYIARVDGRWADEYPDEWFDKCVDYLRYIAYNQTDRDDPSIHQEYAAALESLIKRRSAKGIKLHDGIIKEPPFGKKVYSLRPDALKKKPVRNHKN
jgi:hypothetical protein